MQTLIKYSQYNHTGKLARIQGVIDYVNDLINGMLTDEELDQEIPQALEVYYVDYYDSQVENGGIAQFFTNIGVDQRINSIILSGLSNIKAYQNKAIFETALKSVAEIQDNSIHQKLKELTELYYQAAQDQESIVDLNYAYIATINDLVIVPDEDYQRKLKNALASIVHDYQERKKHAEEEWARNKPRYLRVIEALCQRYNFLLSSVNFADNGQGIVPDEEVEQNVIQGVMYYHFSTDKGYLYAIDDGALATLVDGSSNMQIGSMAVNDSAFEN